MVSVCLIYAEQRILSVKGRKTSFILMGEIVSNINHWKTEKEKVINCGFTPTFGHLALCCSSLEWMSGLEAASGTLTLEEPTISPLKVPLNPLEILISP